MSIFAQPDPNSHPDHLFVYSARRAIGLRGTENSRFLRCGATARQWLHVRGDTVNLLVRAIEKETHR